MILLIVSSVCKVKGMLSLQKSRKGEALSWAIRGQDSAFATYLGDLFLKEFANSGQFSCPDILENLGSIVVTCDRFMFIGKLCLTMYYYFHICICIAIILNINKFCFPLF